MANTSKSSFTPSLNRSAIPSFPSPLTANQVGEINARRGVRLDLSFRAFDGHQLVGFTLNGIDVATAYDCGSGVVVSFDGCEESVIVQRGQDWQARPVTFCTCTLWNRSPRLQPGV